MLEENILDSKTHDSKTIVNSPEKREWFDTIPGERMAIHVQSSDVGGNLAIMETVAVPGCSSPLHFHRESEIFHILEGDMLFRVAEREVSGGTGDTLLAPKLDFAGLGRIAGDVYQAVEQPVGIFCTLPVMR